MTLALAMLVLPLEKAMAPASRSSPISVISSPSRPLVMAAMGCTWTSAVSRARRRMKSTSATSSITGSVLGMQAIVVTPPADAALLAVASVSRCSCPGSPAKTIMSTRPGARTRPAQSMSSASPAALASIYGPKSAMRPSRTSTSPPRSRREVGSTSRALMSARASGRGCWFRSRIVALPVGQMAGERLKHRHAHGHAHLHLLANDTAGVVGDVGVDLDAAVHRPRVHDERVGLGARELVVIEAEEVEVFALARDQARHHALALKPQHHDDVGIGQALAHRCVHLDAQPLDAGRHQGGRRHDANAGAERVEQEDVRPGNP